MSARTKCLTGLLALALLATLVVSSASGATGANAPSRAESLQFGVPFSGTLSRDERYAWVRPPASLLPADQLQFTTDSDGGSGSADLRVCLAPATDDFGQTDTEDACGSPGYTHTVPGVDIAPGKFRRTLQWDRPATSGFILVTFGCGACGVRADSYTLTLEKQIHQVRVGSVSVRRGHPSWRATAAARLTDNTFAPAGHPGYLELRYGHGKPIRTGRGTVEDGMFRLRFRPRRGARRATVRICTTPVGSDKKSCSARTRVRLR
jgi:hypothetical protein